MGKFINFETMITPTIIKILFWVGVGVSGLSALSVLISGLSQIFSRWGNGFLGFMSVIFSIVIFLVGILLSRIYCELLIVLFKMHESLTSINSKMKEE